MQSFKNREVTQAHGNELIQNFVPRMGAAYTKERNYDLGPEAHFNVSCLSPYIRRRLVLEHDVVAAAVAAHGREAADKFVQEVFWRGYFKGWMEQRPDVWASYRQGLSSDLQALDRDRRLYRAIEIAETGHTGLECFDAWVKELVETGYLHNHARMWFASIWIFTLQLPWRIGADFFYRHLLDGDPASNTLGWRWVAGLHTRDKPYVAQAWNIAQFTSQRFTPTETELASHILSLADEEPDGLPPVRGLRPVRLPMQGLPTALLITEEDCRVEDFNLTELDLRATATLAAGHLRSPRPVADGVVQFEAKALADASARINVISSAGIVSLRAGDAVELVNWAKRFGAQQIATPYIPEGPLRDWLRDAELMLAQSGIRLCEWRRGWDSAIWPHATAGFFKVKARIPAILKQAGIF